MFRGSARTFLAASVAVALGLAAIPGCGGPGFTTGDGEGGSSGSGSSGGGSSGGGSSGGGSSGGGSGGVGATGGADTSGGSNGVGGSNGTGGSNASGGTGGSNSTGGAGSGGVDPSGGSSSIGGNSMGGSGGSTTSGGSGGSSGSGTGGGPPDDCEGWTSGNDGYVRSETISGCWQGYGYSGVFGDGASITPTNFDVCGEPCHLCVTGSVAASETFSGQAYVGFNLEGEVGSTTAGTVIPAGTGLLLSYRRTGTFVLRAQVIGESTNWCFEIPVGAGQAEIEIPWSSFNTECWQGGDGAAYARQPIRNVQLVVPSDSQTDIAFNVCLDSAREY